MERQNLWAPWRMDYLQELMHDSSGDADVASSLSASEDATPVSTSGKEAQPSTEATATPAAPASQELSQNTGCFLCEAAQAGLSEAQRAARLVLLRDERGVLLLNRYPYTNGHLLIAPADHLPDLSEMTATQRAGLIELTELGNRLLKAALNPQGVNIGMNLGQCAGAGMPGHVHLHVVPRWSGDVNFMDVVGQIRVIPQALDASYQALRHALTTL